MLNQPEKCPKCGDIYICCSDKGDRWFYCTDCSHEWEDPNAETFHEAMIRMKEKLDRRTSKLQEIAASYHPYGQQSRALFDGLVFLKMALEEQKHQEVWPASSSSLTWADKWNIIRLLVDLGQVTRISTGRAAETVAFIKELLKELEMDTCGGNNE